MTKLTSREFRRSILAFALGLVFSIGLLIAIVAINFGASGFKDYFVKNSRQTFTVLISVAVFTILLYLYFYFESRESLKRVRKIAELFVLLNLQILASFLIGKYVSIIARPVAFIALMCTTLFCARDSIFINCICALMILIIDRFSNLMDIDMYLIYANLLVTFCAGLLSVFLSSNVKTRLSCILIVPVIYLPSELIYIIIGRTLSAFTSTQLINIFVFGAINCILSVMLYVLTLPIFEKLFSEQTVFLLRELTADNSKLIKRLKEKAPGTYNHSVVVAQLVEACAKEIGEDSELARAAALFHDVGKLKNPEMFTENQSDFNYHNELPPELSVDIIRSHARDGEKLIRKNHLPEFFADVAVQHHGTLPVKYFYYKALNMSDGELNIAQYSYPGPLPQSKIAALIMVCDAAEAAARSLPVRTPEKVEALVRSLIEERLDLGQFDECNITMRELTIIKKTVVDQLTGVYHSRVEYPKLSISKKR